ncbi:hypothetical protein LCGC14_0259050 [marine sediment metagenome]|uniref:Uncharacterized protein n=1 Tax=marine sediment metagenome TaxID=412755 RepID=A0A0F9U2I0_9ZZZZ
MNPWIPIAVSISSSVIMALIGFIVKRELGRVASDTADLKKANAAEAKERKEALEKMAADTKAFTQACDDKYLSKELFNSLEVSRKEVDQLRREADGRLEGLIKDLISRHGG